MAVSSTPPADSPGQPFYHRPILVEEVLAHVPKGARLLVDATLGGGGHAQVLLERFPQATLLGADRDPAAVRAAGTRLASFGGRVVIQHLAFNDLPRHAPAGGVDFLLADLGVSSPQLDEGERGFSFTRDGPLDMRMDPGHGGRTAHEWVNRADEKELEEIFFRLGEEKFSRKVVRAIAKARGAGDIATTGQLAGLVGQAIPARFHLRGRHPATRIFQALRMAVNDELGQLAALLDAAPDMLSPGGRVAVISFHSLEDRMVKERFKSWESPCTCPPKMPRCVCGKTPVGRRVTRKPLTASEEEIHANPRSRSAKLRVFEKSKPEGRP
ncbi:MAG: 16S rRNA (cytosine(1402)-N(4))-methyltransferase RsmH [Deltaproteobacteria bacterium]|nr:16S rRNA (cytosine(1402)-N(4))-methyltransferase RsmH [Deltaproteobacteria bacterium]